jgi:hypothetical protein
MAHIYSKIKELRDLANAQESFPRLEPIVKYSTQDIKSRLAAKAIELAPKPPKK